MIGPDVAQWLATNGVKLIGLDVPSVDSIDAKVLQNHHALARSGISIVESLDLSAIASGVYQFVGLPLKIAGGAGEGQQGQGTGRASRSPRSVGAWRRGTGGIALP